MIIIKLLILPLFIKGLLGETGLHKAGVLIKAPINSHKQTNDIVLNGITDQLKKPLTNLQVLRMRLGRAWEWVLSDYGFIKQASGIDLVNHRCKIVVELKNGYCINSIVHREDFRRLQEFKSVIHSYTRFH